MATERPPSEEERKALLAEFTRGAGMIFKNAEELFLEAEALRKNGSFARALFLHQISMEECAKVEMIGAWATMLLMGKGIDLETVAAHFRSHKTKNYTNAYVAEVIGEEFKARQRGDWKGAMEAFNKFRAAFHDELNTAKNASLYVDFKDGNFSAPTDVITEETLIGFWALNRHFLEVTFPHLRLLKRLAEDDGSWQRAVSACTARAGELREKMKTDPEAGMRKLLEEMLQSYNGDTPRQ